MKRQEDGQSGPESDNEFWKQYQALKRDEDEKETKEVSDTEDNEDDTDAMNPFANTQLTEQDKYDLLMPEWAKYMLRLDEHQSLKDFLNVVSGFDAVSSKSDYFVDDNNAFSMLGDVMDMMGDFDDDQKDPMRMMGDAPQGQIPMQQDSTNPIMDAWESMNKFDISKAAQNKWNSVRSYFNKDEEEDDYRNDYAENDSNNGDIINGNNNVNDNNKTFTDRMKNGLKSSGNYLTSWWSKKE